MIRSLWLSVIILSLIGCHKKDEVANPTPEIVHEYSIVQSKRTASSYYYYAVDMRVYVKSDAIMDIRLLSDSSQLDRSYWNNYRTIKGLFDELAKWDTASYIVIDSMNVEDNYPKYISVQTKPPRIGFAFALYTSNYKLIR